MSRSFLVVGWAVLNFAALAHAQSVEKTWDQLEDVLSKHCVGTVYAMEGKVQRVRCSADELKIEEKVSYDETGFIQTTISSVIHFDADSLVEFGRGDKEGVFYVRLESAAVKRRLFDGTHLHREAVDRIDFLFEDEAMANQVVTIMRAWLGNSGDILP